MVRLSACIVKRAHTCTRHGFPQFYLSFPDKPTWKEKPATSHCGLRVFDSSRIPSKINNLTTVLRHNFIRQASLRLFQQTSCQPIRPNVLISRRPTNPQLRSSVSSRYIYINFCFSPAVNDKRSIVLKVIPTGV